MRILLILLLCVVYTTTLNLDHTSDENTVNVSDDGYTEDEPIDEEIDDDTDINEEDVESIWHYDEAANTGEIEKNIGTSVDKYIEDEIVDEESDEDTAEGSDEENIDDAQVDEESDEDTEINDESDDETIWK